MLRKFFYFGCVASVMSLGILKNSDGVGSFDLSAKEVEFTQQFNNSSLICERLAVAKIIGVRKARPTTVASPTPEAETPTIPEPEVPVVVVKSKKPIFDATLYQYKNPENAESFVPIKIIYGGGLLPNRVINIDRLKAIAQALPVTDKPYILDIEGWDVRTMDDIVANKNIDKYILVIDTMKKARPDLKFGYYAVLPDRDYGAPVTGNIGSINKWEYRNKRLQRLAAHVDVVCPSLYTLTDNQEGWKVYATENIKRAREYGKPVYPFIWPEYHNSNVRLAGQAIPSEFWQEQLDLVYQQADGVIIWGGADLESADVNGIVPLVWDENMLWWKVTKQFIGNN
jgi:hypothetical protein